MGRLSAAEQSERDCFLLAETFLFRGCDVNSVRQNVLSDVKNYQAGDKVYTRESSPESLGIVLAGRLQAEKNGVIMRVLEPRDIFGVAALFNKGNGYVSDIIAVKNSRVLFLTQDVLVKLMREDFAVAENYLSFLSGRVCYLNRLIADYTENSAQGKLASFLYHAAVEQGTESPVISYNMSSLASALSIGRASLYRAMNSLVEAGVIERKGRQIVINDLSCLQKNIK